MDKINEGKKIGNGTHPLDIPKCCNPSGHTWEDLPSRFFGNKPERCIWCGLESDYDSSD